MEIIQCLKSGVRFILHGVPERKVYAQVSYLAPNEMQKGRTALITGGTSGIGLRLPRRMSMLVPRSLLQTGTRRKSEELVKL